MHIDARSIVGFVEIPAMLVSPRPFATRMIRDAIAPQAFCVACDRLVPLTGLPPQDTLIGPCGLQPHTPGTG